MSKYCLYITLIFFIFSHRVSSKSNPTNFIKSACQATRYPVFCVRSLSSFNIQTEEQLPRVALAVSLAKARAFNHFISNVSNYSTLKPREAQALKDCIVNMGVAMAQIVQSMGELGRATALDFAWHISNVQTWTSTALTNEKACIDGFAGPDMEGSLKVAIRMKFTGVTQATSNGLALVNQFAKKKGHKLP